MPDTITRTITDLLPDPVIRQRVLGLLADTLERAEILRAWPSIAETHRNVTAAAARDVRRSAWVRAHSIEAVEPLGAMPCAHSLSRISARSTNGATGPYFPCSSTCRHSSNCSSPSGCRHIFPSPYRLKSQEQVEINKEGGIDFLIDLVLYDHEGRVASSPSTVGAGWPPP